MLHDDDARATSPDAPDPNLDFRQPYSHLDVNVLSLPVRKGKNLPVSALSLKIEHPWVQGANETHSHPTAATPSNNLSCTYA